MRTNLQHPHLHSTVNRNASITAPLLICTERDLMLPITTAEVSTTTGPCTSISPFTAPAITADVAVIFPMITEPTPIFAVPEVFYFTLQSLQNLQRIQKMYCFHEPHR